MLSKYKLHRCRILPYFSKGPFILPLCWWHIAPTETALAFVIVAWFRVQALLDKDSIRNQSNQYEISRTFPMREKFKGYKFIESMRTLMDGGVYIRPWWFYPSFSRVAGMILENVLPNRIESSYITSVILGSGRRTGGDGGVNHIVVSRGGRPWTRRREKRPASVFLYRILQSTPLVRGYKWMKAIARKYT